MIVCCGEALIDMLPRQLPDGSDAFLPVPGGAVFNTAIALGRLGEDVQFFLGPFHRHVRKPARGPTRRTRASVSRCANEARSRPRWPSSSWRMATPGTRFTTSRTAGRNARHRRPARPSGGNRSPSFRSHQPDPGPLRISLRGDSCGETMAARSSPSTPTCVPGSSSTRPPIGKRLRRMTEMSDIIKVSKEDLAWLEPADRNFEQVARGWIDERHQDRGPDPRQGRSTGHHGNFGHRGSGRENQGGGYGGSRRQLQRGLPGRPAAAGRSRQGKARLPPARSTYGLPRTRGTCCRLHRRSVRRQSSLAEPTELAIAGSSFFQAASSFCGST